MMCKVFSLFRRKAAQDPLANFEYTPTALGPPFATGPPKGKSPPPFATGGKMFWCMMHKNTNIVFTVLGSQLASIVLGTFCFRQSLSQLHALDSSV